MKMSDLLNYYALIRPSYKSARAPSNRKRGPGRFHVQGKIRN